MVSIRCESERIGIEFEGASRFEAGFEDERVDREVVRCGGRPIGTAEERGGGGGGRAVTGAGVGWKDKVVGVISP